jgi:hypothetical protein
VRISNECKKLILYRDNASIQELTPMGNDIFKYMDLNQEKYRIQFTRNKKGIIDGLYEFDSDGDKYPIKQLNNKQ